MENNLPKNFRLLPIEIKDNSPDDSTVSASELKANKNDMDGNKLEIIDEETKNYIDDMKKGSYNILVSTVLITFNYNRLQ